MVTTGVNGGTWRASITAWGAVEPWDGTPGLDWFVAADDRWHVPEAEPTVRQHRRSGTPVTETRVRVPHGDVVQTVSSCADAGGITVIEVQNESTLPVAIAFDRRDVLTERPIAEVPIEGIELPPGSFVLPLGHRATLRVGIPHGTRRGGALPARLPSSAQVERGWIALTDRASRFVLPDGESGDSLVGRVRAERCELVLGNLADPEDDPSSFVLGLAELVRMGERPGPWVERLAAVVERIAPGPTWEVDAALDAAMRTFRAAGEERAVRDLQRIVVGRSRSSPPVAEPDGVWRVAWLESRVAERGALFPRGFPTEWLGQSIEVHGVPTGPSSSVSLAVRWHGSRPAVLWEQSGAPVELTAPVAAPDWATSAATGEALWLTPPSPPS
jgi:hypothetical protein